MGKFFNSPKRMFFHKPCARENLQKPKRQEAYKLSLASFSGAHRFFNAERPNSRGLQGYFFLHVRDSHRVSIGGVL